jgi:hypothetical protein
MLRAKTQCCAQRRNVARKDAMLRVKAQSCFVSLHDNPLHLVAFLKDLHRHLGTS